MKMNFNEMVEDSKQYSDYVSLKDGETIKGYFSGGFTKEVKDWGDNQSVQYTTDFTILEMGKEPVTKKLSKGAAFYRQAKDAAEMHGTDLESSIFAIKRNGSGLNTKYVIQCVDKKGEQTSVSQEFKDPEVPF